MHTVFISGKAGDITEKLAADLKNAGFVIAGTDTDALLKSSGVIFFISGTSHDRIKEDLNLVLNKNIPVAYIIDDDAVIDKGLEMQLGLATKLGIKDKEESKSLNDWILIVKKHIKARKRKRIISICCTIAIVALIACGVYIGHGIIMDRKSPEKTEILPVIDHFDGKDPAEITILDLSGTVIADPAFIKDAVNLEELYLSGCNLTDISAIGSLSKLKILDLSKNSITDISPAAAIAGLEELYLNDNSITDINPLIALKNLKKLNISNNSIDDFTILDYMDCPEVIK